jgi:hypothetical protein
MTISLAFLAPTLVQAASKDDCRGASASRVSAMLLPSGTANMRRLAYRLDPGRCTRAGARNGFAEPRDRALKIAAIAPPGNAETAVPRLNRGKARKSGPFRQRPGPAGLEPATKRL